MIGWFWITLTLFATLVSNATHGVLDAAGDVLAPTPTPTPTPETPAEAFIRGSRAGGGERQWESHWVNDVIPCESGWEVDPPGYHLGLAQFTPGTWASARNSVGADYRDPWEQGYAVARWMATIAPGYGTTVGWPYCWWVGLGVGA